MPRSLAADHREAPGTSWLLNAFLLLVLAWMTLGTLLGAALPGASTPSPAPLTIDGS